MKEFPESEVQAKCFADAGEKRPENSAKTFADFRPLISRKSGCKKFHEKSSKIFHEGRNKILSPRDSGRGAPKQIPLQFEVRFEMRDWRFVVQQSDTSTLQQRKAAI